MWNRTLSGLCGGLLVAVSWTLTINLFLPAPSDVQLVTAMMSSFVIWAGVFCWCYGASGWLSWRRWLVLFIPSAAINTLTMLV